MDTNYMEPSKTIEADNESWNKTELFRKIIFTT